MKTHDSEPLPAAVEIYDTTLRDGTQGEGLSLSCDDKLNIAERLDALGFNYIEGGWPGSNPKDAEFFRRARGMDWRHSKLCAFGATRKARHSVKDDPSIAELLAAGTEVCTVFGKAWDFQVTDTLRTTLDENLAMIEDTVRYLTDAGRRVFFDAEHFYDGYAANPGYALEALRAAETGGADVVILCDTNGGQMPWQVENATRAARAAIGAAIGVHAHNDAGVAVANSLAAVRGGATQVQGTINGYGERCGNANLCTVAADLELKMNVRCLPDGALAGLMKLSHYVANVGNVSVPGQAPYVGRSAFAHKGGVHVAAMRRNERSYQHIEPKVVGNKSRVVVSELSGRGNLLSKAEALGLELDDQQINQVLQDIKAAEHRGCTFEAAEASVALMLNRADESYRPPFRVDDFKILVGLDGNRDAYAEATARVEIDGVVSHTVGTGRGPVEALDAAVRKALQPSTARLDDFKLVDYKVRILEGQRGVASITRVQIDMTDTRTRWSTVGAGPNIIQASLEALVDAIEFGLTLARGDKEVRKVVAR